MTLSFELKDNVLLIKLPDRIDTTNVIDFEYALKDIFANNNFNDIELDASDMSYISSVGLRSILKIKKEYENTKVINCQKDVYEIFNMTGFTEMMDISKALRVISIEGKELIGKGAYGRVYRISDDTVVKSFYKGNPISDIDRERTLARQAFLLGIPTAISYDIVKIKEECFGAVYELINADSLLKSLQKNMQNWDIYVEMYVNLLKTINSKEVNDPSIPSIKTDLLRRVNIVKELLDENHYDKLLSLVNALPESNHLVHGDCHFKNIFMVNNEPILIDMDTLCRGHQVYELAALYRTYIAYEENKPGDSLAFLGMDGELTRKLFMDTFNLLLKDHDDKDKIFDQVALLGNLFYLNHTHKKYPGEMDRISKCIDTIKSLIDRVDSLGF